MQYPKYLLATLVIAALVFMIHSCSKSGGTTSPSVRSNTFTVSWFRDSTTPNPTAFIDLYNGKAYTMSGAVSKADSIDLFCYDHSALQVSGLNISLIDMAFFGNGTYAAQQSFQTVVGTQALSTYNTSTVSEVSMSSTEFNNIRYNSDIASLFASKALNGGYTDIDIQATDLSNSLKYYQFVCSKTGKRGFFHATSSNYLPGGYMVIEEKVER